MREYNVILKEGIDYDEFWNDIESDTDGGKLYIPNRAVQFTNERPHHFVNVGICLLKKK
jgi:hypothetical protein